MSLKKDIENIFKKNTGYAEPEHAINQAESLKSLSVDLYTDSKRFVYELLQNADDSVLSNKLVKVGIQLFDDFLVVAHTGKPFDKRDLRGICGVSDGTKKSQLEKTGYKGIGFKAVFGQSKKVIIYTNKEYFRFDADFNFAWNTKWGKSPEIWEQENERTFLYPWQIIPIYTDLTEIDESIKKFLENGAWTVATIVLLSKGKEDVKKAIEQLSLNVNMFLFLKNIEELDFNLGTPNIITLHRGDERTSVEIKRNGNLVASWILKTILLSVPPDVKSKLQLEKNIPDKLLNAQETELTFAAKIGEGGIQKLEEGEQLLYAYLPTEEIKYRIPVLVNCSFVIVANREALHEDSKWNQWIFESIPLELLKWVAALVKGNYGHQAYQLIPSKSSLSNSLLGTAYRNGLSKAFETIPFLLSNQRTLIRMDQAIVDFTSFSTKSFITEDVIRRFIIAKYNKMAIHLNPFLPYTSFGKTFKEIGVACFEWGTVSELLESELFLKSHSSSQNIQLIQYFKQQSEQEHSNYITDSVIKNWRFILNHKGTLSRPASIYFPTPDDENWDHPNSEIVFLHQDLQSWLLENPEIRKWLELLGVIEKTDLAYLRKTIIEKVATYSTLDNSIPTILNIFNLYAKSAIGKEELSQLSKLKILTEKGTLLAAQSCYFSDAYAPRLKLEALLDDNIFVSKAYLKNSSEKEEWKRFFKMMGVKEGIAPLKYDKTDKSVLIENYDFKSDFFEAADKYFKPWYTTFNADEYLNLTTLNLLSKACTFSFSKLFWSDLINNIELNDFNAPTTLYWGHDGHPGRKKGDERPNYLKWYIENNICIPTVMETCQKSNDVFINTTDIVTIAGNYLPVFSGDELSPDWRAFFKFKTKLELSDYLSLLKSIVEDRSELDILKPENNEKIQQIYEWFLDSCTNFKESEIDNIKKWSEQASLPDRSRKVFPCSKLNYFIDGDETIFQGEFPFIFINPTNRKRKELTSFLQLFQVKILRQSEFKLNHSDKKPLIELQNRLKTILPYLVKWLNRTEPIDFDTKASKLKSKLENLTIFASNHLEISYKEDWRKSVQVHFDSKTLYVTQPWHSNKVMFHLPEQLCRYLEIKGYEKELGFLLSVKDTQEIKDYFVQEKITLPETQGNVSFGESQNAPNQIVLTPEFLASAGISTQAELEKKLKDPNFANTFIHVPKADFDALQYALALIERAKKNIIAYLSTLKYKDEYVYDCKECEIVSNSIARIQKNGEDIYIITRPSDNNEVIIYYPEEFYILEHQDVESELWYENGKDEPKKLTLGQIFKVTGFNRIPV